MSHVIWITLKCMSMVSDLLCLTKLSFFNRISPTKLFVRMLRIYLLASLLNSKISVHYSLLTLFSGENELDLGYCWKDFEKTDNKLVRLLYDGLVIYESLAQQPQHFAK